MPRPDEDPVLRSARREALVVFGVLFTAMAWTVTYCSLHAYPAAPETALEDLEFVFGFPKWVFWGILIPWCLCIAFSFWFGGAFMRDEQLMDDPDESDTEFDLE
jgi:Protein of unknown function (DUF997)